jgi:vanillate O-demethylase monooxygenase subunit
MDNLLDLTHAPYLHRNTVGGKPEDSVEAHIEVGFQEDERSVTSTYFVPGMAPTPQLQPLYPLTTGDFRVRMRWEPCSSLAMRLSMTPPGQPEGSGVVLPLLHFLTPIDEHHTHYFFALARNVAIDSAEAQAGMMAFARQAFEQEDEPMIAACQDRMGTTDFLSLGPVLLPTDVATVKARRRVEALVTAELAP